MASLATESWWSTFLDAEGRDSEEESAFLGFLSTQGVPADSSPDVLHTAYGAFRTFMEASQAQESADAGPSIMALATEQARVQMQARTVPKSRVSAPGVDKPLTATTRPPETRVAPGETQSDAGARRTTIPTAPQEMEPHEEPPEGPHPRTRRP